MTSEARSLKNDRGTRQLTFSVSAFSADEGEHTYDGCAGGRAMFRIKICGVITESDIDSVAQAGADAIGLNFHPSSIRFVDPNQAKALSNHAVSLGLTRVGVFVDHAKESVASIADFASLDFVQLHGSQTIADALWLADRGINVIAVSRLPTGPLDQTVISAAVDRWAPGQFPVLLDADAGSNGGGMGLQLDWAAIGRWASGVSISKKVLPFVAPNATVWGLAGGLTPETVGEAIAKTLAQSIDVASGVEEPRGKKSRQKIGRFVTEAENAWRSMQST